MATWVATLVLYLFVKPDDTITTGPGLVVNTVPAAVNTSPGTP